MFDLNNSSEAVGGSKRSQHPSLQPATATAEQRTLCKGTVVAAGCRALYSTGPPHTVTNLLFATTPSHHIMSAVGLLCCCRNPQEAHETGVALVVACAQDQAETYVETLRLNGLISSMEPGH